MSNRVATLGTIVSGASKVTAGMLLAAALVQEVQDAMWQPVYPAGEDAS